MSQWGHTSKSNSYASKGLGFKPIKKAGALGLATIGLFSVKRNKKKKEAIKQEAQYQKAILQQEKEKARLGYTEIVKIDTIGKNSYEVILCNYVKNKPKNYSVIVSRDGVAGKQIKSGKLKEGMEWAI